MGWGSFLAEVASVIGDKILMRHADAVTSMEHQLLTEESRRYENQDDLRIVELKKRIKIERDAYLAQFKLKGKG